MASESRKSKAATQTGVYLVVIAAILVMANVLAAGAPKRWDTTRDQRFTLSQGSGELIKSLKEPITIEAYLTTGLTQLDIFVSDVKNLLAEYERVGGENFEYTIIEPDTEELRKQAEEAGLSPMAFAELKKKSQEIANTYLGLVFKYGGEKDVIPQLHPQFAQGLEFLISNKIREIRDKAEDLKHKIGVVTNKDELKLSDTNWAPKQGQGGTSIQGILSRYFPYYEIVDVDLASDVDKELSGLIITQPRKDYTEDELKKVDDFLMLGGKSLAIFASAVSMKPNDATMKATLNLYGLDKLTSGYGINIQKNAIYDFGAQFQIGVPTQGGFRREGHPAIVLVRDDPRFEEDERPLDASFPAFFNLRELAFPYPSALEILRDKQPEEVDIKVVARTTEAASLVTAENLDLHILKAEVKPEPPYERHPIAAVAEGKLKSAFGDKRAPEPSRVLVVSSSQFLINPFAYAGNGPELGGQFAMFGGVGGDRDLQMISQPYAQAFFEDTVITVKNTLDWLSGDMDLLAASAKIIGDPTLTYSSLKPPPIEPGEDAEAIRQKMEELDARRDRLQSVIKWTLTLSVPFAFALFGLWRWRSRQTRRTQLKLAEAV